MTNTWHSDNEAHKQHFNIEPIENKLNNSETP
jgi:hypothetical protein